VNKSIPPKYYVEISLKNALSSIIFAGLKRHDFLRAYLYFLNPI